jgi:hypothetical protein
MTFIEEIESKIRSAYFEIIKRQLSVVSQTGELNCNSYAYITKEIKNILINCNVQGFNVLDTTSTIIYELLKKNYFIHSNNIMACFIGYQFYKKRAIVKNSFSTDGINNKSTFSDIVNHVKTW